MTVEKPLELPAGPPRAYPRRRWSSMARSIVLPLGILAVILGGLWYLDNRGGSVEYDARYGIVALPAELNATGKSPSAEKGRAAPDFLLEKPGGGTLRLSGLQGHPVLLNFWASWCPPCKDEIPELVDADGRYRDQGLVIVGVNLQEPDSDVIDFADRYGMKFPIAIDRDGEVVDAWGRRGPVDGIPTSYFIDEHGVIQDFFYGPMKQSDIEQRVAELLPAAGG